MKKTIFSFAIAAVAALMVSCGGKTENAAGGETTSEGEQATEQVVEEEDANTLSTDAFSMATPEDFEINGKPEYLQKNHEISFRTKAGVTPTYEIKINHDANITFDARQSDIAKLKAIDPIKVGDVSFQGAQAQWYECSRRCCCHRKTHRTAFCPQIQISKTIHHFHQPGNSNTILLSGYICQFN